MDGEIGLFLKEAKGLPLWAQVAGLILTAAASIATCWAIYLVYHPPIPRNIFADTVNATSTTPLMDILSRADDFRTDYEKSNFLKTYTGKYIDGRATYTNFFGGDNGYFLILDFKLGWFGSFATYYQIACVLKNTNQDTKDKLMLLKQGQAVYFVGTFSNSSLNGYYYPTIDECEILKTSNT